MENKSFDDIIKSKLDSFSMEKDANAWELFQESETDATFDNLIAEKLVGFTTDEVPAEFDYLSEGEEGPLGFDALIGAKLAGLSVSDGADWDQFEKILDQDIAFDQEVSNKVAGYEAPLNENQWPKLAAHLEKVEKRRRRIVITKLIEAAVFILFVLSIMQLYPIDNIKKNTVYRTHGVVQGINNSQSTSSDGVVVEEEIIKESAVLNNVVAQGSPILALANDEENTNSNSSSFFASNENEVSDVLNLNKRLEVLAFSPLDRKDLESVLFERTEEIIVKKKETNLFLASIEIPELEGFQRSFDGPLADLNNNVKKDQYWFSIYGSPDLSLINTPFDRSYNDDRSIISESGDQQAYSKITSGYSLGASISKETANWEVEGGIEYSSLNYFPRKVSEVTGKASTGFTTTLLKEIIFDIIELPVNLKYSLFRKKGWKVYGSNGFSAGMVAFANYDIDEDPSAPLLAVRSILSNKNVNEDTFVDRKTFDEGFFKSKNLYENVFATVSAGFGVSKEISDNIAFYVQPTYHYNLSQGGLGPNNDVHHRLSLQIGTKVRL